MGDSFDIAVVGAGIAGLAVAARLSKHSNVVVLEAEDQPSYHATGRSAAIFAQNYGSRLVRALSAWSHDVYTQDMPETLSPRGLVRFAPEKDRRQLETLFNDMSRDWPLDWLEPDGLSARLPLLRDELRACGFENPNAADMDVGAIVQKHVRTIKQNKGHIRQRFRLTKARYSQQHWHLTSEQGDDVQAAVVVNAAGAWADEVAKIAGARPLGLQPLRRSAATFDAPADTNFAATPMAVDVGETIYLKPEAGLFMASPCDETPTPPADSRPEDIDIAICLDRVSQYFSLQPTKPVATWSGLRTFSPDREPICGWDHECPSFFWLAGQGGSGVQTAPALAQVATDMIAHSRQTSEMPGVSLSALSPTRLLQTETI